MSELKTEKAINHIVDAAEFSKYLDDLQPLYARAFDLPPARHADIAYRFQKHMRRDHFTGCLVRDGQDKVLGFSYGFVGMQGDWWHERVRANLSSDDAIFWMPDSFEIAEVAVDPRFNGCGIGTLLVTELRKATNAATVLLTVRCDNLRARKLYERLGFEFLIESLYFPGDDYLYAVMGYRNK